jgi:hypothetical protein
MGINIVNTKTPNYTPVRRRERTKSVGDVPAVEEASKSVTTKEDDAPKKKRGTKPTAQDKHEDDGPLEGMIDERI